MVISPAVWNLSAFIRQQITEKNYGFDSVVVFYWYVTYIRYADGLFTIIYYYYYYLLLKLSIFSFSPELK